MPHIIMEYTKTLSDQVNIDEVVQAMHDALVGQGIENARLKTRAIGLEHVVAGDLGLGGLMAHTTLLLLEGRDVATKQKYGDAIYAAMKDKIGSAAPACKLTLEVRDMDKETYFM